MNKVDSRESLIGVLSDSDRPEQFFVTQFIDSRGKNEFYRKIRVAVVKGEMFFMRVDYDTHWNVHGRKTAKRVPFYIEHRYLLDEERQIINHPEATLGRSAVLALRAIRERIPMDIFGIDFDVDPNGQVVFYEANATMNLFSTANKLVPNPPEADERLKEAFQRYFSSLVSNP